jgi:glycosyltransferase involved in cell wall biosynthesis
VAGVPVLVFPHGMLDPWALRQSWIKRLTKALAWPLVTAPLLRQAARLCFTCPEEMKVATPALDSIPFTPAILPLGVEAAPDDLEVLRSEFQSREPSLRDRKILLFLGRLHPKKGCDLLIQGFAQWRQALPESTRAQYHLRLAGPPHSPEYLDEMHHLCSAHGLKVGTEVTFPGMVEGRAKWQGLAACSAMILPSHQENFGLVVGEALACGKPVLISNRVNIWPWIVESNAGFVADDTLEGVVTLLGQWSALTDDAALNQSRHASALYIRSFSIPGRIQEFAAVINSLQAE